MTNTNTQSKRVPSSTLQLKQSKRISLKHSLPAYLKDEDGAIWFLHENPTAIYYSKWQPNKQSTALTGDEFALSGKVSFRPIWNAKGKGLDNIIKLAKSLGRTRKLPWV